MHAVSDMTSDQRPISLIHFIKIVSHLFRQLQSFCPVCIYLCDDYLRGRSSQERYDERHRHKRADDAKSTDAHHQLKQTRN